MFKQTKGFIAGFMFCALLSTLIMNVFALPIDKVITVAYNNIKIVIDGKEINPVDANGVTVDPFIYNGTTYLPVRAVATALGKEVYWDGPNYTVYLGAMNGTLQYPSLKMEDALNISGDEWQKADISQLTDNYGNKYATALRDRYSKGYFQTLLNMKYSAFKGTAYVCQGYDSDNSASFSIEADGKIIYSSPEITKTSSPIQINVDIRGCNDFKILYNGYYMLFFGDCGFYQ